MAENDDHACQIRGQFRHIFAAKEEHLLEADQLVAFRRSAGSKLTDDKQDIVNHVGLPSKLLVSERLSWRQLTELRCI